MSHKHAPMDCEEVLRHLLEYLDRELDTQTSEAMSHHLEECRGCFSRAEFELKLKESLRAAGSEPASEKLRSRIKDLIDKF
jgi:anti-sigma factor (TIGR02949 family)